MTTYFYQIHPDTEEAEMMDCACSLMIVEKTQWQENQAIADDHLTDDLITATGDPDIENILMEEAEGFFLSEQDPETLRKTLQSYGIFEEKTLFPDIE